MIGLYVDTSSFLSIFSLCNQSWSMQLKDIISATIINCIWIIWFSRNKLKFEDKRITIRATISIIKASIILSGNLAKHTIYSSTEEAKIIELFGIKGHPGKAPSMIGVDWIPPIPGWIKVNTDGASKGSPGHASAGSIFRDKSGAILRCFAEFYGFQDSFSAELLANPKSC